MVPIKSELDEDSDVGAASGAHRGGVLAVVDVIRVGVRVGGSVSAARASLNCM
jgi:hypothetical protein